MSSESAHSSAPFSHIIDGLRLTEFEREMVKSLRNPANPVRFSSWINGSAATALTWTMSRLLGAITVSTSVRRDHLLEYQFAGLRRKKSVFDARLQRKWD